MGIECDNVRDGALSGFCSCGSVNRFRGSRESDLDALGFGWEERIFHLSFPISGSQIFSYFLFL